MSRMLEGTPSDIYSKLTPIRPDTLRELAKLPVLFMTETYTKDDEYDTNKYIRIRLGEIKIYIKMVAIFYFLSRLIMILEK